MGESMETTPLTTSQIAAYCHMTPRSVNKWIEEGKIRSYTTPGGHYRVHPDDFRDFLKKYNMPMPPELQKGVALKRILIVDDEKNLVNSIKRTLKLAGNYEVDAAYDGFDAGRKLLAFKPDLVILDIRMPGMDGYEVAKRIKESPEGGRVRIIAVSAFFEEEGKERILSLGADACLEKPFGDEVLIEKIEEILRHER